MVIVKRNQVLKNLTLNLNPVVEPVASLVENLVVDPEVKLEVEVKVGLDVKLLENLVVVLDDVEEQLERRNVFFAVVQEEDLVRELERQEKPEEK